MNTGMKDGKLVIDMAEADVIWQNMTMEQQYDAMCAMFEPLVARATEMKHALEKIEQQADYGQIDACRRIATEALKGADQ